jgi:tRNA modification GTPase
MAASVFSAPEKLRNAQGNRVIHGWIVNPGTSEKIDEVLVSVFRAPKSYTGEDSLDISCHGGGAAGRAIMSALHGAGFRDALPGEFTFRAFMNGKLDLTRSESVMELVSAKTDTGRRHAIGRLSGVLEKEIREINNLLVQVLAGAEIFLDYSEDEVSAPSEESEGKLPGRPQAEEALGRLKKLALSWRRERIYQEGVLAAIAGRPNAGKSSLFNLLLKEERSIVTDVPGTTRDWIEAWISIEGIPVRLADTAGLRESTDPVEKIGVERSRELLEDAELILYVIDGAQGMGEGDRELLNSFVKGIAAAKPLILIWNKADLVPMPSGMEAVSVSAKTGEGIVELGAAIAAALNPVDSPKQSGAAAHAVAHEASSHAASPHEAIPPYAAAALGSARQKDLVENTVQAVEEALKLANAKEPLDIIAPLLRESVKALGEITGEVSTADILEQMFSRFCVGK